MTPYISAIASAMVLAALAFVFMPNRAQRAERARKASSDSELNQGRRAGELALTAAALGLKLTWDDPALVDQYHFAPFGRGHDRKASFVLRGHLEGTEVVAFDYSFALPGEAHRRQFRVTVVRGSASSAAPEPGSGRWRLAAKPWDASQGEGSFEDRWRVDEHPPGGDATPTAPARELLQTNRLVSSALVIDGELLALIDAGEGDLESVESDVELLRQLAAAMGSPIP